MHTLILGAGYSGRYIAGKAQELGSVCGTRRTAEGVAELTSHNLAGCILDDEVSTAVAGQLSRVTHLLVSVPPQRQLPLHDPMLELLRQPLAASAGAQASTLMESLRWIGYLSTIGVYGNHDGDWVDESTPCTSTQLRSKARIAAEEAWQCLGRELSVPVSVLRLSGIYGPGRNAVDDARSGSRRMIVKPGQVFNRIHVQDLARATLAAAQQRYDGILNITDDEPAPPQDVIRYAHALLGTPAPDAQPFATAELSSMARSFYAENKRVCNALSKSALGFRYQYPSYREGLASLMSSEV
ncbi:MAG: SDR family oxidoreductase [Granulosicoccus sp.]|nr:SDR family oxidoreductase [Granulosicoccus sp.]